MTIPAWLENVLDKHGEFYVRETIKYIKGGNSGDPEFTKPNAQDLEAAAQILQRMEQEKLDGQIELLEKLLAPTYGAKVLEVDGDYLRRVLAALTAKKRSEDENN